MLYQNGFLKVLKKCFKENIYTKALWAGLESRARALRGPTRAIGAHGLACLDVQSFYYSRVVSDCMFIIVKFRLVEEDILSCFKHTLDKEYRINPCW